MPDDRGHSIVSPSGSHQWRRCTKSVRFTRALAIPDKGSGYADEGTIAHWLCEQWLKSGHMPDFTRRMAMTPGSDDPVVVETGGYDTFNMMDHVTAYVDYVRSQIPDDGEYDLGVERFVDLSHWVPGMRGSADSVVMADKGPKGFRRMYVNDFKYGQGVRVPITEGDPDDGLPNAQLALYAFGLLTDSVETVRISIIQPRMNNTVWMDISRDDLIGAVAPIVAAANTAWAGMGRFEASPEICRFCPAMPYCVTAMKAAGLPGFDRLAALAAKAR